LAAGREVLHLGTRTTGGFVALAGDLAFGASSDYIAYFNPLAGRDPSRVLVTGCDLDCGQDAYRLARVLRAGHVPHASIALWSSAEMSRLGMPEFTVPEPFQPVTGWVAVSRRPMLTGDVFHKT
jgi:hypothetical protein